jgi:hypothetical protein
MDRGRLAASENRKPSERIQTAFDDAGRIVEMNRGRAAPLFVAREI